MNDFAAQIETEAMTVHYSHSYLLISNSGVDGKFFWE